MKLMLSSSGIDNASLQNALRNLVKEEIKIAFIPTAANIKVGNKDWLIKDLNNCAKVRQVDIVDISALEKDKWLPRLELANVIFMGGGDSAYLMSWIVKSGLIDELPRLLKNRIYVGISAGSIVLSKNLSASRAFIYGDGKKAEILGLGYVDFYVRPHLNSSHFPNDRDEILKKLASKFDSDLYAIDDNSAIIYDNGKLKVISEGKWIKYPHNQ